MILVDTSIWVDHLRFVDHILTRFLASNEILMHPFVIGELSLGTLRQRDTILEDLDELPKTNVATDDEVLIFIKKNKLYGRGVGYVDVHLLAAVSLTPATQLWTRDRNLHHAAKQLGFALEVDASEQQH